MTDIEDSWKASVFRGLQQVGSAKPVGYLPLYTVADVLGLEVETLMPDANARGLSAVCFDPRRCCIKSGAIYVYDRVALAAILEGVAANLMEHQIPFDPDGFIEYIAANWLDPHHPIHAVVVRAFGGLG